MILFVHINMYKQTACDFYFPCNTWKVIPQISHQAHYRLCYFIQLTHLKLLPELLILTS